MEILIENWLKTNKTETSISPAEWVKLPEECRERLNNFARDEAVHRTDQYARDGFLDLGQQDAIRQIVDAMAQAWKLEGQKVRAIVEDYLDELPPVPGREFEKVSVRVFRRIYHQEWENLAAVLNEKDVPVLVETVLKGVQVPGNTMFAQQHFLILLKRLYDHWTINHPKEAVIELLGVLEIDLKSTIQFNNITKILEIRGAKTWLQAIELEREVEIHEATKDELIRILKRYALIMKREMGKKKTSELLDFEDVEEEPVNEIHEINDINEEKEVKVAIEDDVVVEEQIEEYDEESKEIIVEKEEEVINDTTHDIVEEESDVSNDGSNDEMEEELSKEDRDAAVLLFGEYKKDVNDEESSDAVVEEEFKDIVQEKKRDRFETLRNGELRNRVVEEMYSGDATLLDVFLAKLSGAPDWNRAKQFIANEFFRCELDLHSELGEEFFNSLKDSIKE